MQKKFEINQTKIKGSCQSGRKVVTHDSKSDLPLCALHSLAAAENAITVLAFTYVELAAISY